MQIAWKLFGCKYGTLHDFLADCPRHQRGNRHLLVCRGPNDTPHIECLAGCTTADVLMHVGMSLEHFREQLIVWWNTPAYAPKRAVNFSGRVNRENPRRRAVRR